MKKLLDIQTGFRRNIITNSVSTVSEKRAIAQMISNLLSTETIEIPFKEWEGAGLQALLGEACSQLTANVIVEQIRFLLEKYMYYIELQDISYQIDYDNQTYVIILYYTIIGNPEIIEQTLYLEINVQ